MMLNKEIFPLAGIKLSLDFSTLKSDEDAC